MAHESDDEALAFDNDRQHFSQDFGVGRGLDRPFRGNPGRLFFCDSVGGGLNAVTKP